MTEPIQIRPLALTDFDGFAALQTNFYEHANNPAVPETELRRLFDMALAEDRNFRVIVAESAGELVGIVSVTFGESSYRAAPFAWCDDLLVLPGQRGKGVGKLLLQAIADLAREARCSNVLLGVGAADVGAQEFYRSQGFFDLRNRLFSLPLEHRS